jgi:hypothetical protein
MKSIGCLRDSEPKKKELQRLSKLCDQQLRLQEETERAKLNLEAATVNGRRAAMVVSPWTCLPSQHMTK